MYHMHMLTQVSYNTIKRQNMIILQICPQGNFFFKVLFDNQSINHYLQPINMLQAFWALISNALMVLRAFSATWTP